MENSNQSPIEKAFHNFQNSIQSFEKKNEEIILGQSQMIKEIKSIQDEGFIKYTELTSSLLNISNKAESIPNNIKIETIKVLEDFKKKLSEIDVKLNEKDKEFFEKNLNQIRLFNKTILITTIGLTASLLIVFTSLYFVNKFYETSIRTKTEIREDLIKEIKDKGKMIVSKDNYEALDNERIMLINWIKNNPNDSKSYIIHRKAKVDNIKDRAHFKDETSETINGSISKYFLNQ